MRVVVMQSDDRSCSSGAYLAHGRRRTLRQSQPMPCPRFTKRHRSVPPRGTRRGTRQCLGLQRWCYNLALALLRSSCLVFDLLLSILEHACLLLHLLDREVVGVRIHASCDGDGPVFGVVICPLHNNE